MCHHVHRVASFSTTIISPRLPFSRSPKTAAEAPTITSSFQVIRWEVGWGEKGTLLPFKDTLQKPHTTLSLIYHWRELVTWLQLVLRKARKCSVLVRLTIVPNKVKVWDSASSSHWDRAQNGKNYFRHSAKFPQYFVHRSIKLLSNVGFPKNRS